MEDNPMDMGHRSKSVRNLDLLGKNHQNLYSSMKLPSNLHKQSNFNDLDTIVEQLNHQKLQEKMMRSYNDKKKLKKMMIQNPDVQDLSKKYKKMKKDLIKIKNSTAKFNGNDFDPMNQLKSGVDHLNYQIADFRARNTNLLASENQQIQSDLQRMRNDEDKRQWREHFKDKYRESQVNGQIQALNSHIEQKDFLVKSKLQASSLAAAGALNYGYPHSLGYGGYSPYGAPGVLPGMMFPPQAPYVGGPVPFFPPQGVNPLSLHQPYYMKRNPTFDYINTQHRLFQDTQGEIMQNQAQQYK